VPMIRPFMRLYGCFREVSADVLRAVKEPERRDYGRLRC
jgi:hypothetical protein